MRLLWFTAGFLLGVVMIAKKRLRIGEQLDSGVCEYVIKNLRSEAAR